MKGFIPLIGVAVIVVVALVILTIPGLSTSIVSSVTGTEQNCEDAPYIEDCTCGIEERKIFVPWVGIPRWDCEVIEQLIIDPESPTFESDAITFAQDYLTLHCGTFCTDLSCGGNVCGCPPEDPNCGVFYSTHPIGDYNNPCISAVYGYGEEGERIANIECVLIEEWADEAHTVPASGTIPWRMNFFLEGATNLPSAYVFFDNYCADPGFTDICEPPMNIVSLPITAMLFPSAELGSGYPAPA